MKIIQLGGFYPEAKEGRLVAGKESESSAS
jgi:hypothetical protein